MMRVKQQWLLIKQFNYWTVSDNIAPKEFRRVVDDAIADLWGTAAHVHDNIIKRFSLAYE